ncbi:outer membrane lipoprotein carrier protein LolA [Dyadobacter chenwenxiniae]|uniref:Outer membrane lipoprotein carrier protein LolA n=1 Tax=Dyadobacter chenwenxiniae TaxID=2906456 RepID=A0A9X1PJ40_9BACT|nr:outer membrane lipoprotein carrier protein LolA [Dyadobacter chenwenxiniae]MCF0062252.1 outer membrane lipoprotein carrier protein LolA [Dyadobacter chenwenxiniae]UON83992.1 outer membrane lipoprotein carrier protein LolA [Dyadobacter chenwenxiniae]
MNKFTLMLLIFSAVIRIAEGQSFNKVSNPEKVFLELRKASQSVNSIQAAFTEEKMLSVLKEPGHSSGVFYYKKSDKMRWEQKSPSSYVILINSDKLRVQEAGKEKNVGQASRMAGQIKELMIGLVNGDFQQNKAFAQSCLESTGQYMIVLTPVNRRLKNIYSKITLVFPKSTLHLKELSFFEKGGDKSVMKFQNEKFNHPINDSLFSNF